MLFHSIRVHISVWGNMHEYVNIVHNHVFAARLCLLKLTFHNHYANNAGTDSNRNGFVYSMSITRMRVRARPKSQSVCARGIVFYAPLC